MGRPFEKENTGPLKEHIENCEADRIEAIYNKQYRYIKEIIWDTEAEEKYGTDRAGYEKFKQDTKGYSTYSGEIFLREVDGVYFTEEKLSYNKKLSAMYKEKDKALEKTKEILGVKDNEAFEYWINNNIPHSFTTGANEVISYINSLEELISKYNEDEEFKHFFDKVIK
jgi:hypothetical protein